MLVAETCDRDWSKTTELVPGFRGGRQRARAACLAPRPQLRIFVTPVTLRCHEMVGSASLLQGHEWGVGVEYDKPYCARARILGVIKSGLIGTLITRPNLIHSATYKHGN